MPGEPARHIERSVVGLGVVLSVLACTSWVVYAAFAEDVIRAAFEGRSIGFINTYVAVHRSLDPESRTLDVMLRDSVAILLRLSVVLSLLGAGLLIFRHAICSHIVKFLSHEERPEVLALLRIAVGAAFLFWLYSSPVQPFALLPGELVVPPPGLSWVSGFFPPTLAALTFLQVVLGASATMLLLGLRSNLSAWIATGAALLVMGVPQFFGKIDHYHHLVWFSALLAVSRSGDAWSLDATLARRRGEGVPIAPDQVYALPLRIAMILIGLMYLFPGVWKIIIGGWAWTGETLQYQMYAKWMSLNWVPALRLDEYPMLMRGAGIGVLLMELLFLAAIMSERYRPVMAFGGILFHISVYLLMDINFWMLAVCYVVFIDGEMLRRITRTRPPDPVTDGRSILPRPRRGTRGPAIVGAVLVACSMLTGFTLLDTWPVAVYPTFAGVPQPRAFVLTFSIADEHGGLSEIRPLRDDQFRCTFGPSRAEGLVHQVVWQQDPERREAKARALVNVTAGVIASVRHARRVVVRRDLVSVVPGAWNDSPLRRDVIAECDMGDGHTREK